MGLFLEVVEEDVVVHVMVEEVGGKVVEEMGEVVEEMVAVVVKEVGVPLEVVLVAVVEERQGSVVGILTVQQMHLIVPSLDIADLRLDMPMVEMALQLTQTQASVGRTQNVQIGLLISQVWVCRETMDFGTGGPG